MFAALVLGSASAFTAGPRVRAAPARAGTVRFVSMRTSVIGGNWKMNPQTIEEAKELAVATAKASTTSLGESIIFAPYPFLGVVGDLIKDSPLQLGAQSVFFEDSGAYTGSVSVAMVKSMGVTYVLAGHSERRTIFKDDDGAINRKVLKILNGGMIPVVCVGESKDEFDANLVQSIVTIQLSKDLAGVTAEQMKKIVIAYEPVWAIGTGLVCPTDVAQSVHKFIRSKIAELYDQEVADAVRIQYGGSVTPDSVDELMSMPDIDGCLVGGASLVAAKFDRILNYVA